MAIKLGTLQADIGADTSQLKRAELETTASLEKMNSMMRSAEKEARTLGVQHSKLAKGFFNTRKAANDSVSKGFKPAKNAAQQFGFQMQDVIVQLQSGTSAFTVFAQQGSQLAGVFGAGGALFGAVIALAGAVGGILWKSLNDTAEATELAATSAEDLTREYLKLTGASQQLQMFNMAEQMKLDAAAGVVLGKELSDLKKKRDELTSQGPRAGIISKKDLEELDKDIRDTENRLSLFSQRVEFQMQKLNEGVNKNFGDMGLKDSFDPEDFPEISGRSDTFEQGFQKEIAALALRGQLFGDSNAAIEAEILRFELAALTLFEEGSQEYIDAEQALQDKRVELRESADKKIFDNAKKASDKIERQQNQQRTTALNSAIALGDQLNAALEKSGKEGSAIGKAVFLATKALQVAQIIAATEVAAANAAAVAALGGPVPFFATAAAVRAVGYASAGLVAGLSAGEAFENGGIVGGGSFTGDRINARVNSGEMILNRNQQAKLFSMANHSGGGGNQSTTMPNVTIINEGTPQEISVQSFTKNDIVLIARDQAKQAENRVNASLASGRGETFASLRQGTDIARKIN